MSEESLKTTLVQLEAQGWDSLCDGTGGQFYGELMTQDAVMVLANGMVMDRAAVIESLEHAPPWSGYEIGDERVIRTGPDSAILVYLGRASRDGDASSFVAIMSSAYRLQDGEWRLCLYQQTPVPDGA